MRQGRSIRAVTLSLGLILGCHSVMAGCAAAGTPTTSPSSSAATAEVTVTYKGQQLSRARIVAHLGQEASIDSTTDDGHRAVVTVLIEDAGSGNYRTAIDVQYDGATVGSNAFLSAPGQTAEAESEELWLELRVSPA